MGGNAQPQQPQYGGAPDLYRQYQQFQPGSNGAQDMIRQMQGSDNGAAFNANMKNAGYARSALNDGSFSYAQPQQPQQGTPQFARDIGQSLFSNVRGGGQPQQGGMNAKGGGGGGQPQQPQQGTPQFARDIRRQSLLENGGKLPPDFHMEIGSNPDAGGIYGKWPGMPGYEEAKAKYSQQNLINQPQYNPNPAGMNAKGGGGGGQPQQPQQGGMNAKGGGGGRPGFQSQPTGSFQSQSW